MACEGRLFSLANNLRYEAMNRIYTLLLLSLVCCVAALAQNIRVSAPSEVATGSNFQVSYTIANHKVEDFRASSFPDGLEVIAGPYTSTQSSYSMVNGKTSSSQSITYTYTVYASKAGKFTVGPAKAKVDGKAASSSSVTITVSGSAANANGRPQGGNGRPGSMRKAGTKISGNDLFVKVSASKTRVYEQEPVLLTYKVYTLVDLTQLDVKMPDLTGFHTQEVPMPQQKSFHLENVNGRNYRCVTWSQYVLYPQVTGKLSIPSITFNGVVVQQTSVDPFEEFFNGGSGYTEVKHSIVAPGLQLQVDPLPNKPAGFSGAVGQFAIAASLDQQTIKAGSPLTMRITVTGKGNMKLIKQPVVDFPKDFDRYNPKVSDNTKITANGLEGSMSYDYLVVPRNKGDYVIPSVTFIYYDTSLNAFKTLKTEPIKVKVEPGDGKSASVTDYSDKTVSDIRGIKTGSYAKAKAEDSAFYVGSMYYWLMLALPTLVFVLLLVIFRKRAAVNADVVGMRGRRANKVAAKRLKKASSLLASGAQSEFYDEVLRALWGYVGDKMNMPVERLSRDNITENLVSHGIPQSTIDSFLSALDECEFERYAPGDAAGNMTKTYNTAEAAIMDIENTLKSTRKNRRRVSPTASVLLAMLMAFAAITAFGSVSARAATKAEADAAYAGGDYARAAAIYEQLLVKEQSGELYYNLGNAKYRLGESTQAIIAYERALRFTPGDADARYNLEFLYSKTADRVTPVTEMFFVTWYRSVRNMCDYSQWALFSASIFVLMLLLLMVYLLSSPQWLRKVGFFGAMAAALLFVTTTIFSCQQKHVFDARAKAVVTEPSVNVKNTPSDAGSDSFVIHEGTRVHIIDRTMKQWYNVRLDDGKEGWLKKSQVEVI